MRRKQRDRGGLSESDQGLKASLGGFAFLLHARDVPVGIRPPLTGTFVSANPVSASRSTQ